MCPNGPSNFKEPCPNGCQDVDLTEHDQYIGCGTPYCSGGHEVHCRRCGFFSVTCSCGSLNSYDTISERSRRALWRRGVVS